MVTGARRGTADAIAFRFAAEVADTVLGVDEGGVAAVADKGRLLGVRALPVAMDVTGKAQVSEMFA